MPDKFFEPKATPRKQKDTLTLTYDAASEYQVLVNGVVVATQAADTDADTTAEKLKDAWEASTSPYSEVITATRATNVVTLESSVTEVPFTVTTNIVGGAGTLVRAAVTTPTGPHTLDEPENWNDESLPANNDRLFFRNILTNIMWGLDGITATGLEVFIERTFIGYMGLNPLAVATSSNGANTNLGAAEYRPVYAAFNATRIEVGGGEGVALAQGSARLVLHNTRAGASLLVNHYTPETSADVGKPSLRYKVSHASADISNRGHMGINLELPGETSQVNEVHSIEGGMYMGDGTTLGSYLQDDGKSEITLRVASATKLDIRKGTCVFDGDQNVGTVDIEGGASFTYNGEGDITTACNVGEGCTLDASKTNQARTIAALNAAPSSIIKRGSGLTVTAWNHPEDPHCVTYAPL